MGGMIFVNYRRDDSAANALAIASYLEREFGSSRVFIDVDRLRAGQNFPEELERRLSECKAMVCLIGPGWGDARNEEGGRRLDDTEDWVRLEIERALTRGLVVIPVLVGGACMPKVADLPAALKPLVERQAVTITTNGFRSDMAGLTRDLRAIGGDAPWGWIGVGAGGLALAVFAVFALSLQTVTIPRATPGPDTSSAKESGAERRAAEDRKRKEASRLWNKGEAYYEDHEYDQAIAAFSKIIDLYPTTVEPFYMRGRYYIAKKDYDSAIADFTKAIDLSPKYAAAYHLRGVAYHDNKDYDHALADFTRAIDLDPTRADAHLQRGRTKLMKSDIDGAIADYTMVIYLDSKLAPTAYKLRGYAYLFKGDVSRGAADDERAKELGYKH
jgi:tetratricopeptide (TPR) repeat protein